MATGPAAHSHSFSSSSSNRPRKLTFSELLRSPFRSSPSPDARSPPADWYIPYNGPVEPPRHPTFLSPTTISSSSAFEFPGRSMPESRGTANGSTVASRRVHKSMNGKSNTAPAAAAARQTVLSLDKGGIGESPAAIVPDDYRNNHHHHFMNSSASARRPSAPALFVSSAAHSKDAPVAAATPYLAPTGQQQQQVPSAIRVERHPFNPHGFDNYIFPTNTGSTSQSTSTNHPHSSGKLTLNLPSPSSPLYNIPSPTFPRTSPTPIDRHPYAANVLSRAEQIWPNITGTSTATATTSRSLTASGGTVASDRSASGLPYAYYGSDRVAAGPSSGDARSSRNQGMRLS